MNDQWIEVRRLFAGVRVFGGDGAGTVRSVSAVYEVTERNRATDEYRIRVHYETMHERAATRLGVLDAWRALVAVHGATWPSLEAAMREVR